HRRASHPVAGQYGAAPAEALGSPRRSKTEEGGAMARLPKITSVDQVPAKDRHFAESIAASRGDIAGPFTAFLHSPELAARVAHLGAYVRFEGTLDMKVRVLAAMTVARE